MGGDPFHRVSHCICVRKFADKTLVILYIYIGPPEKDGPFSNKFKKFLGELGFIQGLLTERGAMGRGRGPEVLITS